MCEIVLGSPLLFFILQAIKAGGILGRQLEFMYVCSFPSSGPKRYDIIDGRWQYSHDRDALHDLLSREFSKALGSTVDLSGLEYSNIVSDGDSWA